MNIDFSVWLDGDRIYARSVGNPKGIFGTATRSPADKPDPLLGSVVAALRAVDLDAMSLVSGSPNDYDPPAVPHTYYHGTLTVRNAEMWCAYYAHRIGFADGFTCGTLGEKPVRAAAHAECVARLVIDNGCAELLLNRCV